MLLLKLNVNATFVSPVYQSDTGKASCQDLGEVQKIFFDVNISQCLFELFIMTFLGCLTDDLVPALFLQ